MTDIGEAGSHSQREGASWGQVPDHVDGPGQELEPWSRLLGGTQDYAGEDGSGRCLQRWCRGRWGGTKRKTQKEGNSPIFFLLPSFQDLPSAKSPQAIVKRAGKAGVWEKGSGETDLEADHWNKPGKERGNQDRQCTSAKEKQ